MGRPRTRPGTKAEYLKQWHLDHPGYQTDTHIAWRAKLHAEAIIAYGGSCACCGESKPVFLDIDHIDGGRPEGQEKLRSWRLYNWARKHDYPPGFRVLCRNCNWATYAQAVCPHQT